MVCDDRNENVSKVIVAGECIVPRPETPAGSPAKPKSLRILVLWVRYGSKAMRQQ